MVAWLWIFSDAGEAENVAEGKEGSLMLANSLTYSCIWYFYVYLLWGVFRLIIMLCYFFIFNIFFTWGGRNSLLTIAAFSYNSKCTKQLFLTLKYQRFYFFTTTSPCPLRLNSLASFWYLWPCMEQSVLAI